jgi:hypothetical protein
MSVEGHSQPKRNVRLMSAILSSADIRPDQWTSPLNYSFLRERRCDIDQFLFRQTSLIKPKQCVDNGITIALVQFAVLKSSKCLDGDCLATRSATIADPRRRLLWDVPKQAKEIHR